MTVPTSQPQSLEQVQSDKVGIWESHPPKQPLWRKLVIRFEKRRNSSGNLVIKSSTSYTVLLANRAYLKDELFVDYMGVWII